MTRVFIHSVFVVMIALLLCSSSEASESSIIPERRKPQFNNEFGYAVFPYPYSLPGIGQGLGLVGGAMNIDGSYTDAYGMIFGGEVKGIAAGVADLHLIPRTLILETGVSRISAAAIQSFRQRGMLSNKNDYFLIEMGDMNYYGTRLTSTFFDRRFEIYGAYYQGSSVLKSIRDRDGNLLVEAQNPPRGRGQTTIVGTRMDLTDDYQDPRRGFRIDVGRTQTPPRDSGPDFFVMDYNTTAYVPIGRRSTWAFNYLRSDAHVTRKGVTDPAVIEKLQGLNCGAIVDPVQQQACNDVVQGIIDNNTYGTASALGGFSRLRSYPTGRFKGAHTEFYGSELRWNLTDEATPFDIFVMKDVRTSWQVSLFYELGSTADIRSQVGDVWRSSYGLGLRMVTASGVVFRADLAAGREGLEPDIFIGYPWEF
jgi:hypothetical protein